MPNKPNKHRLPVGTLALVVLLLILSACQPTPEKEPVVVKTEDYVAEAIQPKDGTHDKYDAPNNVEFHNEISGFAAELYRFYFGIKTITKEIDAECDPVVWCDTLLRHIGLCIFRGRPARLRLFRLDA